MGYLWLQRGFLALRIHRKHLGERALRNVVEQGTSLFAWRMLLDVYTDMGSINSTFLSISEVLEAMESNGLAIYEKLPLWIEQVIF